MARIRSHGSKAEWIVRRTAHKLGLRYRLHSRKLPGTPDLVFAGRRKVIFVHGCFWHRHEGCKNARLPKSRLDFWLPKLDSNRERDDRTLRQLSELGWDALVIWECETRSEGRVATLLRSFFGSVEARA